MNLVFTGVTTDVGWHATSEALLAALSATDVASPVQGPQVVRRPPRFASATP